MITSSITSFYTEQDRETISKYDRRIKVLLEDARRLKAEIRTAKDSGDQELCKELETISRQFWPGKYAGLEDARNEIIRAIEQRCIEAYSGNIEAILADVREIVAAIEKSEYLAYQSQRSEEFKPLLENMPGKDSPAIEKKHFRAVKALCVKGYTTCYYYIMGKVRIQLNALDYYHSKDGAAQALAIIEDKAASFYAKPKKQNLIEIPAGSGSAIQEEAGSCGDLLTLPTSPTLTLMYDLLGSCNLDVLSYRKKKYNRNIQLKIVASDKNGNKRRVSYSKGTTEVSIEIDDFRKIINRNPQAKKILTRILIRMNEQAIHNGALVRDLVSFPLAELVGEGQYKNLTTARRGFYNVGDILTGLKVSGKIERGKEKTMSQGCHAVLFKLIEVNNSTCLVYLNERLNWGLITPYYTGLPSYYFELPDRASELLEYIFYIARQNTKKISEDGFFTISYRALQYRLNLPNEEQNRNPKRDIKDAIETAIIQINEKHAQYALPSSTPAKDPASDPDFLLVPLREYDAPIKKYLDEGKLKIVLKGDYASKFIALNRRKAAKLESDFPRENSDFQRGKSDFQRGKK